MQPVDLLTRGSFIASFALFLVILNAQALVAPAMFQSQAAAVVKSTNSTRAEGGVVISDYGANTEYFVVDY